MRGRATSILVCGGSPQRPLEALAREAAQALELATGYTDVIERARRLEATSPAAEIQQSLLAPRIADLGDAQVVGSLLPAYDVGGDWFDHADDPDRVWLAVADAVGKGPHAAAISALGLASLRAGRRSGCDLERCCALVDETLGQLADESWMTACVATWERATRTFTWVACGHPSPLLIKADGSVEELDGATTYPLGVLDGSGGSCAMPARWPPGSASCSTPTASPSAG